MAYRQYTQCISASAFKGKWYGQVLLTAAAVALTLIFAGVAVVGVVMLTALAAIIAYCRWWLYGRLICLGGDACAVGMLLTVETPDSKSCFSPPLDCFDTDYSINLVLAPNLVGATQADAEGGPQGNLLKEQPDIASHNLDFRGSPPDVKLWGGDPETWVLHCEFEGGGVYDLLLAALAALPFAAAGAVACSIPVIGWVACLILGLIAGAITLVGIVVALNDQGNPDDVDQNLGELHTNDPTGRGADILVVMGSWVYDSAHEGWNEIHPIKHCQKIRFGDQTTWEGNWDIVGDVSAWVKDQCEATRQANDPATVANQARPENQWTIHPLIDGCQPAGEPPPR